MLVPKNDKRKKNKLNYERKENTRHCTTWSDHHVTHHHRRIHPLLLEKRRHQETEDIPGLGKGSTVNIPKVNGASPGIQWFIVVSVGLRASQPSTHRKTLGWHANSRFVISIPLVELSIALGKLSTPPSHSPNFDIQENQSVMATPGGRDTWCKGTSAANSTPAG